MPVHLDSHEPDVDLKPGTAKSDIVAFLYDNPKLGFKPKEIEDHLKLPHGTVTTTLKRLHDDGLIGKTTDSHYHALKHREDLHRYVTSLEQTKRMFENLNKDSEKHTDIESPISAVDEDKLDAELTELEDELQDE